MRPIHAATGLLILLAPLGACGGGGGADAPGSRTLEITPGGRWPGNAVCYGPHRDGQEPGGATPSPAQLREDVRLMSRHWGLLRVYGAAEFAADLLEAIRAEAPAMKVMLGVWIEPADEAANCREADAAVALANAYPDIVVAVCVGNETQVHWAAHRCPPEQLLRHVRRVRAAVSVPVTTADDFSWWLTPASRAVAAELDILTLHAHPMWNGRQLDEALPWLEAQIDSIAARHPDRTLVLGETGWATSAADHGEQARLIRGTPGEGEQAQFLAAVTAWAQERRLPVFWFEAFDENWKGGDDPAEVEKHWGLYRADRTPKAALGGTPR